MTHALNRLTPIAGILLSLAMLLPLGGCARSAGAGTGDAAALANPAGSPAPDTRPGGAAPAAGSRADAATPGTPGGASTSRPSLTVTVVQPRPRDWAREITATGSIQAWQEAVVGAEVGGMRIAKVRADVGQTVRRGQVLATLDRELVAASVAQQAALLAEARANLAESAANFERARSLKESDAVSQQEVLQYQTKAQTGQAEVELAEARLNAERLRLRYTDVTAPDDGIISSRTASVGSLVQSGAELFRLIRKGRLEWRAEVPEGRIAAITPGQQVSVRSAGGAQIEGIVRLVSPQVDAQTRNGLVYVDVPSAGPGVKPGMFAEGSFFMGREPALTVPQDSVVTRDGYDYIFRVLPDHKVRQVRVTAGRRQDNLVEIRAGLQSDDLIVGRGAAFLADGQRVAVAEADDKNAAAQGGKAEGKSL